MRFFEFLILAVVLYLGSALFPSLRDKTRVRTGVALILSFAFMFLPDVVFWAPRTHHSYRELRLIMLFYGVPVLTPIGLAARPAMREKSWKRFAVGVVLSFLGIVLPLFIFTCSAFLVPGGKNVCKLVWLDCFMLGKLALIPIVLWACAGLWQIEINRTHNGTRPWVVYGIFLGSIVSMLCTLFGITLYQWRLLFYNTEARWLLVPLYVSVWYTLRAYHLIKLSPLKLRNYILSLLGTIPFWIASIIWSKKIYAALPDKAPGCFVATAASRGHTSIVGSLQELSRDGQIRRANQQLMTLWQLEAVWQQCGPWSHRAFRRVYNVIGPVVARQIRTRLAADLVYLTLKPVEWFGRWVVGSARRSGRPR